MHIKCIFYFLYSPFSQRQNFTFIPAQSLGFSCRAMFNYISKAMYKQILLFFSILCLYGCANGPALLPPAKFLHSEKQLAPRLSTQIESSHQGEHSLTRAAAYLDDKNNLAVIFEPELPAYWLGMHIDIKGRDFQARPYGVPFAPGKVHFEVMRQELALFESDAEPQKFISGRVLVEFIQHEEDGSSEKHYFKGYFSAPLKKPGDPAPTSPEGLAAIAAQDLDMVIYEFGEPRHLAHFLAKDADSFRRSAIGANISPRTEVLEATWDVSCEAPLSDGGRERLSVWYTRQGDQWFPVAHRIWTKGSASQPAYLDEP